MDYELEVAAESDKEFIRTLNERCYREVVESQFGGWDYELQRVLFEKKWEGSTYQKIIFEGRVSGVLVVDLHEDHVFLSEIQIEPDLQRRGIGTEVISGVLATAGAEGLPVRLRVLHRSHARALYERLGFVITGKTETHHLMERAVDPSDASD